MLIEDVFVADISDTEQSIGVVLRESPTSSTVYVINHNYNKGLSDADVRAAIQAKIDAFKMPQTETTNREDLIKELLL